MSNIQHPKDWKITEFSEIVDTISNNGRKFQTKEYLSNGQFPIVDQGQNLIVGYTNEGSSLVTDLPVIVFGDHTRIVKFIDFPFVVGADGTKLLKPVENTVDRKYFFFLTEYAASKIHNLGYSRHFKELREALVPYANSFVEQEKIGSTLMIWDKAINKIESLIIAKIKLKRALEQRLMTGAIRLPGFSAPFKFMKLKDVTIELKSRNQDNLLDIDKVMGVNKVHGLIPMREETIGANLNRYKIVPPQAFAYNPMRLNIGSLAISDKDGDVLVSPDYVVFSCKAGQLDPEYFNHYRRSHIWVRYMEMAGNGSVRIRIYYKDLSVMKIRLPDIKEQKAIAAVLNKCTEELDALQAQLAAFKKQKRGLMQKLLTGQWRVKGAA